jgi:hypothetical protein
MSASETAPLNITAGFLQTDKGRLALAILIGTVVTILIGLASIDSSPQRGDANQNLTYAYNLLKYGVFSLSQEDHPDVPSDIFREPFYPFLLAGMLRTFANLDNVMLDCFLEEPDCADLRLLAKRVNIPLYIALTIVFVIAAKIFAGQWRLVYFGLVLLLSAEYFYHFRSLTELPATLLLLLHALFMYLTFTSSPQQRRTYVYAALSSVMLGLLVLTKAAFLYWIVVLAVGLGVYTVYKLRTQRYLIGVAALLILPAVLLSGMWMVRNYQQFGEFKVAGREGLVLALRAEFTYMTSREYIASFAFFSTPALKPWLLMLFDPSDYHRLDRDDDATYFRRTMNMESEVAARAISQYGLSDVSSRVEFDQMITAAALSIIRENWHKHALLTLTFAYRGSFVYVGPHVIQYGSAPPVVSWLINYIPRLVVLVLAIFYFPAFLWVVGRAAVNKHYHLMIFFLPVMYSFGIHAVATHYIPRYSTPLVPFFIITFVIAAGQVTDTVRERFARRKLRGDNPAIAPEQVLKET